MQGCRGSKTESGNGLAQRTCRLFPTPSSAPLPESAEENQPHASAASPESRHQSKDLHHHQSALLDEFFAPAVPMPSASSVGSVSRIAMNEPSTSKRQASSSAVLGPALASSGHWTLQTRKQSDETSSADQGLSPSRHDDVESAGKVREGDSGSGKREKAAADDDNISPSKRTKSDIAPWMTQRHNRAIRRSLEAAAVSSSPAKSPAAKPATASDTSA